MLQEVLWKSLMINGSIVMFWRPSLLEKYIENIREEGFDVYIFDCESWDRNSCLLEIGNTLEFPDYYGRNLNAFNDCLSDIVPSGEGFVLVFKNFDKFNQRDKDTAYHILDIIQNNSWRLLVENQKKLIAFLHSNDPQLHIESLGALPVRWNNEEWFDKNRGV
ncbi:Barstar (barnase inhibitor) [Paenibacillus curdlanolyticus YK9]|uniref:Barstar (Barnase inhibitor) n=2 Tax=Paenibacillus curdlanolyticus TaxID=59840 RepID=E0IAD3_9BACL|nr:Barstar (barnase inhibitor) [Paenibacillus curdlanolyticus YK9]